MLLRSCAGVVTRYCRIGSRVTRGRCNDNKVLQFSTIFCEKISIPLKNQYYDQIFECLVFVLSQKRNFFANCLGENILKICPRLGENSSIEGLHMYVHVQ
jgi:hypothetical protein